MTVRICVCVCFMFGFQTRSPCKGIISPSLPDVNKKYLLVQKMEALWLVFKGISKWNFANPVPELAKSWDPHGSGTFFFSLFRIYEISLLRTLAQTWLVKEIPKNWIALTFWLKSRLKQCLFNKSALKDIFLIHFVRNRLIFHLGVA